MKISKKQLHSDLEKLKEFSKDYFLHPIEHIKNPPVIEWQSAIVATFLINIVYGLLRTIYHFSFLKLLIGLIVTPLLASAVLFLTTLFLFYFFQFSFKQTFPFKTIASILFISYLPGSLFFLGSALYPPLFLMGLIVMSGLVAIGLVENFKIPRKTVLILVSTGAFLAVLFWVFDQFYVLNSPVEPKTLDQLENEIEKLSE